MSLYMTRSTAAALLFTIISSGHLKAAKTTVLMSVEDTMEAYPGPDLLWSMPS